MSKKLDELELVALVKHCAVLKGRFEKAREASEAAVRVFEARLRHEAEVALAELDAEDKDARS